MCAQYVQARVSGCQMYIRNVHSPDQVGPRLLKYSLCLLPQWLEGVMQEAGMFCTKCLGKVQISVLRKGP